MSAVTQNEINVIVKLRRAAETDGWETTAFLEEVPEAAGYYGLDDGLRGLGGGVTLNMRSSLRTMAVGKQIARPIYRWKPDADGSATDWLNE